MGALFLENRLRETSNTVVLQSQAELFGQAVFLDLISDLSLDLIVVRILQTLHKKGIQERFHRCSDGVLASISDHLPTLTVLLLHQVVSAEHLQVRVEVADLTWQFMRLATDNKVHSTVRFD